MNINTKREYIKEMAVKEINAKSILRKMKTIESWFVACYGMNLYRGCTHDCVYCDGRDEKYQVAGEFAKDIEVKINAAEILQKELDPKGKRKPLKKGFIMVGGGVGDSYQPIEKKYELSRKILHLINDYDFPVHILTKSTLVRRDIDILKKINERNRAIVSFSFSSSDDNISRIFEPGVPSPTERLETIAYLKSEGISCGMFLMPVIPFITDKPEIIEDTIRKAKDVGVDFVVFGGMTLKEGKQQDYFYNKLEKYDSTLFPKYKNIYYGSKWGNAKGEYYGLLNNLFNKITKKYKMPKRMPMAIYKDMLYENDLIIVVLEQMDYVLKLNGDSSPYGYAAYSVSQLKEPISSIKDKLTTLKGVGKFTEKIILEILDTGTSSYYEKLMG